MRGFKSLAQEEEEKGKRQTSPSKTHTWNILIGCLLVVIPMVVFTIVILCLVFTNTMKDLTCPYNDICPDSPLVNITSKSFYYIDYPAARLVWISSFSSTVSFALVGVIMGIFAYASAAQLLRASSQQDPQGSLPSPYQTSLLVRVLGSDYLSLWELLRLKRTHAARRKSATDDGEIYLSKSKVIQTSVTVFILCLIASILIQVADAYLHIYTKAVQMTQILPQQADSYQYSRQIAPWCSDNATFGTSANINFWSCGLRYVESTHKMYMSNRTKFFEIVTDKLAEYTLDYTDADGNRYTIIGPPATELGVDWRSSSFALSTKCNAIPETTCNINNTIPEEGFGINTFQCNKSLGSPIDIAGELTYSSYTMSSLNFHKYLAEETPFFTQFNMGGFDDDTVKNATVEDANDMFRNPWQWIASVNMPTDTHELLQDVKGTAWALEGKYQGESVLVSHCETTVYDVEYTVVNGSVSHLSKKLSNSTTAGIASMTSLRSLGFMNGRLQTTGQRANATPSLKLWLETWAYGMSETFMAPLVVHTLPAPNLLAHKRAIKIATRLPVASLWLLVLANLAYAALAIAIAILAWRVSNENVHQVRVRLGVAGLASALFENGAEHRVATADSKLFLENVDGSKAPAGIGVCQTETGGVAWVLRHGSSREWTALQGLSRRSGSDTGSGTRLSSANRSYMGGQIQPAATLSGVGEAAGLLRRDDGSAASMELLHVPISPIDMSSGTGDRW